MRRRWKEARRWAKNPEAVKDWAWRAMHLSVITAKDVVEAYYGQEIQYSYYNGCSTGGRQGLKEVQTFPDDFDGAVIGAPAWWTVHLQLWNIQTSCFRFWLRRVSGTPEKMNAPWYIGGTTQASVIGGDSAGYWIHNQPGFHNPRHDALLALVSWVENGTAPTEMIATKWNDEDTLDSVTRQRPICMYPQQAKYVGHGDPDIASSWECRSGY